MNYKTYRSLLIMITVIFLTGYGMVQMIKKNDIQSSSVEGLRSHTIRQDNTPIIEDKEPTRERALSNSVTSTEYKRDQKQLLQDQNKDRLVRQTEYEPLKSHIQKEPSYEKDYDMFLTSRQSSVYFSENYKHLVLEEAFQDDFEDNDVSSENYTETEIWEEDALYDEYAEHNDDLQADLEYDDFSTTQYADEEMIEIQDPYYWTIEGGEELQEEFEDEEVFPEQYADTQMVANHGIPDDGPQQDEGAGPGEYY